jgi:hypothetical protein
MDWTWNTLYVVGLAIIALWIGGAIGFFVGDMCGAARCADQHDRGCPCGRQ